MQPTFLAASPLLPLIGLSVVLLVVHILLQGMTATKELGSSWNAGPRDDDQKPTGTLAGRAARTSSNFRETYPGFVALAFGLILAGDPHGFGLMGGWVWLACRVVYIPLYLVGIPYIRSLVWLGSMAGLAAMLLVLMF
ncbi:putative MAPEG superfamily protein [Agrobacterium vitis]|nr:putative MAPEG superfamily protein [Agrobacterium vitis]MBE1439883.1 putative MAPEG superfamily protein [Agrobacterium vitis]